MLVVVGRVLNEAKEDLSRWLAAARNAPPLSPARKAVALVAGCIWSIGMVAWWLTLARARSPVLATLVVGAVIGALYGADRAIFRRR